MSLDPAAGSSKASDLRTLFLNFHHVLNEYRPHQAREQLIQLMQERLDQTRAETAANRAVAEKARRVLEGLGSVDVSIATDIKMGGGDETGGNGKGVEDEEGARYWEREGMGWGILDAEFA